MRLLVLLVVLLLFLGLRLRFFFFFFFLIMIFSFKIKILLLLLLLLFIYLFISLDACQHKCLSMGSPLSAHDIAYSREYTSTKWTRNRGFSWSHHLVQVQELNVRPLVGALYIQILGLELRYTGMGRCQAYNLNWPIDWPLLILFHILII